MTRIRPDILKKAFEIGFTYQKETYWDKPFISLPCSIIMDNGENFEFAELVLIDKLYKPELFKTFNIEQVSEISDSKFTINKSLRIESTNPTEYRNDFPFFLRKRDNGILGFNASSPINFTYNKNVLGSDILETVSFEKAQLESFEFIRNHTEIPVKIICGYDKELVEQIEKINYS